VVGDRGRGDGDRHREQQGGSACSDTARHHRVPSPEATGWWQVTICRA
jgi:hypothetical protein